MEAISSVPRKRIRIMDVRGFKGAGHVLKGFWHIGTHSKSVNMSALDPAMGKWVSMLVGHLLAGVKDIFRNGAPNCLVIVMICTGGRHRSVMCRELVHRLASLQGIECCAIHLCQSTWGRICSSCEHCSWNSAPRCDLAKLRDQNLRNITELIQKNLLRSLGTSAQTTYVWKCVLPNVKLNRSHRRWTEAERIAEVEAAAGSGSKASAAAAAVTTAAGSAKQAKGAKGSSSATSKPTTTAKSKAAASSSAAGSSQGLGSQKAKKPPLPPPADDPEEIDSSGEELVEEEEEEKPKVSDMVVDPEHDVSKERERSVSASAATRLPLSSRTGVGIWIEHPKMH